MIKNKKVPIHDGALTQPLITSTYLCIIKYFKIVLKSFENEKNNPVNNSQ